MLSVEVVLFPFVLAIWSVLAVAMPLQAPLPVVLVDANDTHVRSFVNQGLGTSLIVRSRLTGEAVEVGRYPGWARQVLVGRTGSPVLVLLEHGAVSELVDDVLVERIAADPMRPLGPLALSADNRFLASIEVAWSTSTWTEVAERKWRNGELGVLADGDFVIDDRRRWSPGLDVTRPMVYETVVAPPHPVTLNGNATTQGLIPRGGKLRLSHDGASMWIIGAEARRVDTTTGEILETHYGDQLLARHDQMSPDGQLSLHRDGRDTQVFHAEGGHLVASADVEVVQVRWHGDSRSLLCTHVDGYAHVWELGGLGPNDPSVRHGPAPSTPASLLTKDEEQRKQEWFDASYKSLRRYFGCIGGPSLPKVRLGEVYGEHNAWLSKQHRPNRTYNDKSYRACYGLNDDPEAGQRATLCVATALLWRADPSWEETLRQAIAMDPSSEYGERARDLLRATLADE